MKNIYNEEVKDKAVPYTTDMSKSTEKKTSNKKFIIAMIVLFFGLYIASSIITYFVLMAMK